MAKKKRKAKSKQPRRQRTRRQKPSGGCDFSDPMPGELPGGPFMEPGVWPGMRQRGNSPEENALEAAQDLVYQAMEAPSPAQKLSLAKQALECSADCADAYVLLAEHAPGLEESVALYELGVAAGARVLGAEAEELEGHYWGYLPTRPYMRARAGLAAALWVAGRADEAVGHYRELLRLNPGDNQGIRYQLAAALLDMQRHEELASLLDQFPEDDMAEWSYTRALLAFRVEGESEAAAMRLQEAHSANAHVPEYLTGANPLPREIPHYMSPGGEDEAVLYASQYLPAWRHTPGSITWLRKTLQVKLPEPTRRPRPSWKTVKQVLSGLPRKEETWEVELKAIGSTPSDKLWTMAIADATRGEVLMVDLAPERPSDSEVWWKLLEVMRDPEDGDPGCPARIQVTRKTFHRLWESKLGQLGIVCEVVDALPAVDQITAASAALATQYFDPPPVPEDENPDLSSLPQNPGEVWQADVRRLAAWMVVAERPQRPWIAFVGNATDDLVCATDLAESSRGPEWLWEIVLNSIFRPPNGPPHLPGVIEVDTDEKRRLLAERLEEYGVKCVVTEQLQHVDMLIAHLTNELNDSPGPKSLFDSPGVTEELVGELFHAAADFYRQAPWRSVPSETIVRVEGEALTSQAWYLVVMGQSGINLGLALYEDLETIRQLMRQELTDEENARRMSTLSVTFDEEFDLAAKDVNMAEKHGWPIAGPEAYPCVMRVKPGMAVSAPLKWELELLIECLKCIPAFLQDPQSYEASSKLKLSILPPV